MNAGRSYLIRTEIGLLKSFITLKKENQNHNLVHNPNNLLRNTRLRFAKSQTYLTLYLVNPNGQCSLIKYIPIWHGGGIGNNHNAVISVGHLLHMGSFIILRYKRTQYSLNLPLKFLQSQWFYFSYVLLYRNYRLQKRIHFYHHNSY